VGPLRDHKPKSPASEKYSSIPRRLRNLSHTEEGKPLARERSESAKQRASNITRRVLAIFINQGTSRALKVCQIVAWMKADYDAVYSAIRRFCKHGFVKSVKKMVGNRVLNLYVLSDKATALEYLGFSDLAFLGKVPRSPFKDWVDLGQAFYEGGPTGFRVDGYVCGRIRGYLEGLGKAGSGDRSRQLSFACESFSLVITRHGHVRLWIKSRDGIGDFFDFLVSCGLDDGNRAHVFRKLAEKINDTKVTVEAPVLNDDISKITIETKVGNERLVSRICGSHFPRELEVSGAFGAVQNFFAALAGAQHFSMLEWVQADRLDRVLRAMLMEARAHERVAEAIESFIGKPAQQRGPERKRRSNYVA